LKLGVAKAEPPRRPDYVGVNAERRENRTRWRVQFDEAEAAATLRSRRAGSQDESPCGAIHKFDGNVNCARLQGRLPLQIHEQRQRRPAEAGRCNFKSNFKSILKSKFKNSFNNARLKSRRPLQIQIQIQVQIQIQIQVHVHVHVQI
jgi:hypothetical protein